MIWGKLRLDYVNQREEDLEIPRDQSLGLSKMQAKAEWRFYKCLTLRKRSGERCHIQLVRREKLTQENDIVVGADWTAQNQLWVKWKPSTEVQISTGSPLETMNVGNVLAILTVA